MANRPFGLYEAKQQENWILVFRVKAKNLTSSYHENILNIRPSSVRRIYKLLRFLDFVNHPLNFSPAAL